MKMKIKADKILERTISSNSTILDALRQMDNIYQKLLIIVDDNIFKGLISVGDIQRAIVRNTPLSENLLNVIRKNIRLANENTELLKIKEEMFEYRMELMPIVSDVGELVDVIFWEDVFETHQTSLDTRTLDIPVVIMAGGLGTRLRPLTNVIPKPLIPLNEKPIIEEIISRFNKLGVSDFIVSGNYKFEILKYHLDSMAKKGFSLQYVREKIPLGTAGSLKLLEDQIDSTFFVTNCDILIDQDYRDILDYHRENQNELTLVSSIRSYSIPYGTIELDQEGALLSLNEKPEISYFINAGMYILEPHLLKEIPRNTQFHITELINNIMSRGGKLGAFPVSQGSLVDIGTWSEYLAIIKPYK